MRNAIDDDDDDDDDDETTTEDEEPVSDGTDLQTSAQTTIITSRMLNIASSVKLKP